MWVIIVLMLRGADAQVFTVDRMFPTRFHCNATRVALNQGHERRFPDDTILTTFCYEVPRQS